LSDAQAGWDVPLGDDLRGRAAGGAAFLGARGLLVYVIGIVANIALARLLAPRDFGIFALGMVVVVAGTLLAEGGLGGALIKRAEPPLRSELQAVAALQLGATALLALVVGVAALPLEGDAELVAVMALSLPIAIVRAPSMIILERRLDYGVIATAELAEAVVFYAVAIGGVAAGLGVWGLAIAVVVRALVGSATLVAAGPIGLVKPKWAWSAVRPLLGFGAKVQAGSLSAVAREQLLNVGVSAVAGLGTLGVWALAWRVMQVPALLFQTVGRVAFPTMSRLLSTGRDVAPVLERQVAAVAVVNAVIVVGLVGFAPALPAIVGPEWHEVPAVLLWSGIALLLAAPIVVSAAGYLLAAGMAGVVALVTAVSGLVWLIAALPLLAPLGPKAVGIAWAVSAVVNAALLWSAVAKHTEARIAAHFAPPAAISLVAAAVGWFVAQEPDGRLLGGLAGLAAGEALLLAGLAIVSRPALVEVLSLAREGLHSIRPNAA
jgi:O-antigen/teichoic acid export membrane protein